MAFQTTPRREFVDALTDRMKAGQARDEAGARIKSAGSRLRAAGQGDDLELMFDMVEEAVSDSGLPDDNKYVQHLRKSVRTVAKVKEAIASGVDPAEARAIGLLGGDPRRADGGFFDV